MFVQYVMSGKVVEEATVRTEPKGGVHMTKLMVRNHAKGKESKVFPYEMTELVWEGEKELEKSLRREIRQMEWEIKRHMFWQRCLRSVAGGY